MTFSLTSCCVRQSWRVTWNRKGPWHLWWKLGSLTADLKHLINALEPHSMAVWQMVIMAWVLHKKWCVPLCVLKWHSQWQGSNNGEVYENAEVMKNERPTLLGVMWLTMRGRGHITWIIWRSVSNVISISNSHKWVCEQIYPNAMCWKLTLIFWMISIAEGIVM